MVNMYLEKWECGIRYFRRRFCYIKLYPKVVVCLFDEFIKLITARF